MIVIEEPLRPPAEAGITREAVAGMDDEVREQTAIAKVLVPRRPGLDDIHMLGPIGEFIGGASERAARHPSTSVVAGVHSMPEQVASWMLPWKSQPSIRQYRTASFNML